MASILIKLKNEMGETTTNRDELLKIVRDFYLEAHIEIKHSSLLSCSLSNVMTSSWTILRYTASLISVLCYLRDLRNR